MTEYRIEEVPLSMGAAGPTVDALKAFAKEGWEVLSASRQPGNGCAGELESAPTLLVILRRVFPFDKLPGPDSETRAMMR